MSSDVTRHTARAADGGGWTVSWLPGRTLTRDQAITAGLIAEVVVTHADELADSSHRLWLHIDGWAAELGMTGPNAVAEASLSPEDHADMPRVRTLAFDGEPGRTGYMVALDKPTGMARVRIDGETVTMPAAHLQYDSGEDEDEVDEAAARSALISVMTAGERAWLLGYIAGRSPQLFDEAATCSASRGDDQAARVRDAR